MSNSLCEDFLEEVTLHQDSEQKGPSWQGDPTGRGPHAGLRGDGETGLSLA